jgi:hypothetical protein
VRGRVRTGLCLPALLCLIASGCGASRPTDRALTSALQTEPVQFLPGGMDNLAQGHVPGAASFSILAERYRFQHRTYFNLAAHVREIGGGSQGTNFTPQLSKPLAWSIEQGCSPSAAMWTIVFGVLADPHDRAYAYATHGRYRLQTATIPVRFGTTGVAAYALDRGRRDAPALAGQPQPVLLPQDEHV